MPRPWHRRRQKLEDEEDPCAWLKEGVHVDPEIYQSSYMADYKPFGKQKYSSVTPQEQAKLDTQLRNKEFYRPPPQINPRLQDGYPAFKRPYMTAKDLGLPGFFPPKDRGATGGDDCNPDSICPLQGMALPALTTPRQLSPGADLQYYLNPKYQPGSEEDKDHLLLHSSSPHHWTGKVPLLNPLGPPMAYYQ
ncbi:protein SPMIP9 isoform X1 [Dipodomys merriami]|uniref:protein SPMIP9 isoform X1 n=1 Tax=Dipodomys merriami TaxID=94247 RepID=UPI003855B8A0